MYLSVRYYVLKFKLFIDIHNVTFTSRYRVSKKYAKFCEHWNKFSFLSTFSYFLSFHRISSHRQFTPDQAVLKEKVLFPWICKNSMSESGILTSQQYQVCLSTAPVLVCLLNLFHFTYFQVTLSKANLAIVKTLFFLMFLQKKWKKRNSQPRQ